MLTVVCMNVFIVALQAQGDGKLVNMDLNHVIFLYIYLFLAQVPSKIIWVGVYCILPPEGRRCSITFSYVIHI